MLRRHVVAVHCTALQALMTPNLSAMTAKAHVHTLLTQNASTDSPHC